MVTDDVDDLVYCCPTPPVDPDPRKPISVVLQAVCGLESLDGPYSWDPQDGTHNFVKPQIVSRDLGTAFKLDDLSQDSPPLTFRGLGL